VNKFFSNLPFWGQGLIGVLFISISIGVLLYISGPDTPPAPATNPAPPEITVTAVATVSPEATAAIKLPPPTVTATVTPSPPVTEPAPASAASTPLKPTVAISHSQILPVPVYTYTIVNTYPHDRDAFTQGLVFIDGIFYEGTGLYGRSSLRAVTLDDGEVTRILYLSPTLFGEGITVFGDKIIQLTWKSGQGFVYNKDNFELLREFTYPTEGWGITHDGERLIMSDGSNTLYFWNPETLEEIGRVEVFDETGPVTRLNELEYINGEVFANVWQTHRIARIDPDTGQVVGWIILPGLLPAEDRSEPVDVLNGIAYDAENNRLFVTGKLWPKIFEIKLVLQE